MVDTKTRLAAALRRRNLLRPSEPLVVAWEGRLLELDGFGTAADLSERPGALLGATRSSAHLLSRLGVLSFALATARAHTDGHRRLEVSGVADSGTRFTVALSLDIPVAIATQLSDMQRAAISDPSTSDLVGAGSARRPPPKRRSDGG